MFAYRLVVILIAVLFGSMAPAASVQNINIKLGFAGHTYYNIIVRDSSGEILFPDEPEVLGGVLEQADDVWGLPRLFDFAVGEVLRLTATIDKALEGGVLACNLGGLDCATEARLDDNPTDPLSIFYGTTGWFRGGLTPGSSLVYDLLQFAVNVPTESGDFATWFVLRGEFNVLEDQSQPAPIPLPAPALLLPVGLAGLAMLRRGQKRQSA